MKWAKLSRRFGALFLALAGIWCLMGASGPGSAADLTLAGSSATAPALWERLLVGQSPYLQHGKVLTFTDRASENKPATLPEAVATPTPTGPVSLEDETPIAQNQSQEQNVVAQTILPTNDGAYPSAGGVFLYNRTSQAVDLEALAKEPVVLSGQGKGPQILIVHTHATESYTQSGQDLYTESDPYRTLDDAHNVVRVGDEMAAAFAQAGLNVLHDRTLHDYPNYNGAYTRSKVTVEEYLAAYPSIAVVLDVHRDALVGSEGTVYKVVADSENLPGCAQVMLVVGTEENGGSHPNWHQNLAFAMTLERALNEKAPTLARPIALRKSHYNQNLSPGSLLVEVGGHGNSLAEALTAARTFAQATAPVIKSLLPEQQTEPPS